MKSFILAIFFFLLTQSVYAQKSLSPHAFQVNIRPALSGIINDFYQMISLFPEFPKDLPKLVDKANDMEPDKIALKEKCPQLVNAKCMEIISNISNRLSVLQGLTLGQISNQKMSQSLQMINIAGIRLINQFQADLELIKYEIDNFSFKLKAGVDHRLETYYVIKKLDELNTIISLSIVEFVPFPYKDDFRNYYFNFIHPVELHISQSKNYEFLNRNINSLNFTLNLLNMNLTKRNKKTPDGMAPYLNLMHNRWNSILRYYF